MGISIRRLSTVLALLVVAVIPSPSWAGGEGLTQASGFSFGGTGPVRIGMTVAQVERIVGSRLASFPGNGEECQETWREDGKGVSGFLATDGIVQRVDIVDAGILTVSGVGVGDTEETVKRVYGKALRVEQHA